MPLGMPTRKYLDRLAAEMAAAVMLYGPRSHGESRACCGAWASEYLGHLGEDERQAVIGRAVVILAGAAEMVVQ